MRARRISMAAARTWAGSAGYVEDWADAAWHNGGVTQNCDTDIAVFSDAAVNEFDASLNVTEAQGTPLPAVTLSRVAGTNRLRAAVANGAAAGNRLKWTLGIRRIQKDNT